MIYSLIQLISKRAKSVGEIKIAYKTEKKNLSAPIGVQITSSKAAEGAFRLLFDEEQIEYRESFWVLYLNRANKIIGWSCISEGGLTGTVVDTRMVFQGGLLCNASGCLLAHNHPSGQLKPSDADKAVTKKLKEAGRIIDITVLDHLILTAEDYLSFTDEGIF